MANYKFQNINAGLEIKAPAISVNSYYVDSDGTGWVNVGLSLGNPQANAVSFEVQLMRTDFPNSVTIDEVTAWVTNELTKYEI